MACITASYKWTRAVKKHGRHPTWVVMKRRGFQMRTAWQAVNLLSLKEICHKFTVLTHKIDTLCHHRLRKHAVTKYWLLRQKCHNLCVLFFLSKFTLRVGMCFSCCVMTVLKVPRGCHETNCKQTQRAAAMEEIRWTGSAEIVLDSTWPKKLHPLMKYLHDQSHAKTQVSLWVAFERWGLHRAQMRTPHELGYNFWTIVIIIIIIANIWISDTFSVDLFSVKM